MNDNKSRDIFYGVVAIATLIVAIVGATLAYFSITASSREGAVNAKAAVVSINYSDTQQVTAQADELIPSSISIMQYYYEKNLAEEGGFSLGEQGTHSTNQCIDINGKQVCSVYRFSVSVDGDSKNITATLRTEDNGFNYLEYAVREFNSTGCDESTIDYDTTYQEFESTPNAKRCWMTLKREEAEPPSTNPTLHISLPLNKCSNTDDEAPDCYTVGENNAKTYNTSNPNAMNSIFGLEPVQQNWGFKKQTVTAAKELTYDLVLFLNENGSDQNIDQGKEYHGTIVVDVQDPTGGDGRITGKATNN